MKNVQLLNDKIILSFHIFSIVFFMQYLALYRQEMYDLMMIYFIQVNKYVW